MSDSKRNRKDDSGVRSSLESRKSGFDFMSEARDFNNIITNLKVLLHKNGCPDTSSKKSFMTL